MSQQPIKIYTAGGEYIAAVKHAEDAAALLALHGPGATARLGHKMPHVFWTEGETGNAADSYDAVVEAMHEHQDKVHAAWVERSRKADERFRREHAGRKVALLDRQS